MTRVLVTNDDGIDSPGLTALARCAVDLGHDVVIAAPAAQASGSGAGLTAAYDGRKIPVKSRILDELPSVPAFAVSAHPALIAMLACRGGFGGRFDLVLSGINLGANLSRAILHSGTVGAALTAGINDCRGLAVSLGTDDAQAARWEYAAPLVTELIPTILADELGTVLSLNVPNAPGAELREARLAPYGAVQSRVVRVHEDGIEIAAMPVDVVEPAGSDEALLHAGFATLTPLRSVSDLL